VKLLNLFVDVFCILVFLTLGSLMVIVAFHILPMEDALIKVQTIYESGFQSGQLAITGFALIVVGLALSKAFIKKTRAGDDFLVVESDAGRLTVTFSAISELTQRVLKKFEVIRQSSVSTSYERRELKIVASIHILPGWNLSELTRTIERDVKERVVKMLHCQMPISVMVNVVKIEEAPSGMQYSSNP